MADVAIYVPVAKQTACSNCKEGELLLVRRPERKTSLAGPACRWKDDIKIDIKGRGLD